MYTFQFLAAEAPASRRLAPTSLRAYFFMLLFLLPIMGLWPQSASYLDSVLQSERIRYQDAAYLLLLGAGLIDDELSPSEALRFYEERGWGLSRLSPQDELTLGGYSLMTMRVFELRGGPMYSLFPVRRYALRELRFRGLVQGRSAPGTPLSGERAVRILERTVRRYRETTA
ncbi:MAG: hypothetical protein EA428_05120 [Spirochaetaceae bacterium]|nr:MAG: hypothetical protein EA428_05120 [Spirochaetaceae bacterium]